MNKLWLEILVFCTAWWRVVLATNNLVAKNLVYHVDPGDEVVITLRGFSLDGSNYRATITSLPANGQLYQLSQVFSDFGYDPKRAVQPITSVPVDVTGSLNRVVFVRPVYGGPAIDSKYAEFTFTITNDVTTSTAGRIVVTTNEALVTSSFDTGIDNWTILNNGNGQPVYQPLSRGLLSYYMYGTDSVIHRTETGDDSSRWYFNAPSKFLGNNWAAYGGSLRFVLASAEGDFSPANLNQQGTGNLVRLECVTCQMNAGVTLAMPLSKIFHFDGSATQFVLPLKEDAGWLKDPKNVLLPWTVPTQCELVEVLSKLSALQILGDFTRGYESVAIDTISFLHGDGFPRQCY